MKVLQEFFHLFWVISLHSIRDWLRPWHVTLCNKLYASLTVCLQNRAVLQLFERVVIQTISQKTFCCQFQLQLNWPFFFPPELFGELFQETTLAFWSFNSKQEILQHTACSENSLPDSMITTNVNDSRSKLRMNLLVLSLPFSFNFFLFKWGMSTEKSY